VLVARSTESQKTQSPSVNHARDRIVRAAYDLFTKYGIQAVGVDRIVEEAGVAKTTLYRHFASKEDLVVATLDLREQLWTREWLQREVERRGGTPAEQLLSIFDAFDEWFRSDDYHGCFFLRVIFEYSGHETGICAAAIEKLDNLRAFLTDLVAKAEVGDPIEFARRVEQLVLGSIAASLAGDDDAALRAKAVVTLMLQDEPPRAE
jgi:AcrR family transcriptional regulator